MKFHLKESTSSAVQCVEDLEIQNMLEEQLLANSTHCLPQQSAPTVADLADELGHSDILTSLRP